MSDRVCADKVCKACGQTKPVDKFPKLSRARDGREGTCYSCKQSARNAKGISEQQREAARLHHQKWKRRNPVKVSACKAVWNAVRSGRLVRGACDVCGAANAEAHHSDYRLPFDVRWLCKEHHEEVHVRADQRAA